MEVFVIFFSSDTQVTLAVEGEFGPGVGTIQFANVSCIGNESSLQDCDHVLTGPVSCVHDQDIGVDCMGRPLRES